MMEKLLLKKESQTVLEDDQEYKTPALLSPPCLHYECPTPPGSHDLPSTQISAINPTIYAAAVANYHCMGAGEVVRLQLINQSSNHRLAAAGDRFDKRPRHERLSSDQSSAHADEGVSGAGGQVAGGPEWKITPPASCLPPYTASGPASCSHPYNQAGPSISS